MTSSVPPQIGGATDKGSPYGGLRLHVVPGRDAIFHVEIDGKAITYRAMFIDADPDRTRVVAIRQTRKGDDYQVAGLLTTVVLDVSDHPTPGRDLRALNPQLAAHVERLVHAARDGARQETPTRWHTCPNHPGRRTMHASGLCRWCRGLTEGQALAENGIEPRCARHLEDPGYGFLRDEATDPPCAVCPPEGPAERDLAAEEIVRIARREDAESYARDILTRRGLPTAYESDEGVTVHPAALQALLTSYERAHIGMLPQWTFEGDALHRLLDDLERRPGPGGIYRVRFAVDEGELKWKVNEGMWTAGADPDMRRP